MSEDFIYIDDRAGLEDLAARLRGAPWLCVDTEFMREHTYYPRLCLLQVASADTVACIDPLALDNLDPLLEVLYDPATMKVLHAAKQDLEIFYHLTGKIPTPLFDTQVAAAVLLHNDQIGYANLVERVLGVQLEKAHTRTDWSLRPLDAGQLRYAADDVIYLRQVYHAQCEALEAQGRMSWLTEDFATLADPASYAPNPEQVWKRVKEARRLKGRQLAVLKALAAWREERAMRVDKPRKWVLRDEVLTELARRMPESRGELAKTRGLDGTALDRLGAELLQAIAAGAETPQDQWPELEPRLVVTPAQEAVADTLMALLRLRASEQELSPAMLATRKDLERLVLGDPDVAVRHGWRRALAGADLERLLEGSLGLRVKAGKLTTTRI
jgi:ribonuclease D